MRYNTRRLLPGDEFEASTKHAKLYVLMKRAEFVRDPGELTQIPQRLVERVAPPVTTLYGSSILEATYQIGDQTVQLGEIVKNAHAKSELTPEQWNMLPTDTREALLADELKAMQAAASPAEAETPTTPTVEEVKEDDGSKNEKEPVVEDLDATRARYKEVVGRAAYGGWDVAKINEKIAEFQAAQNK